MPNDSKPAQWPWAFFFATPFFTPNIFQAPTAIGLMAFSTALFAAAWMHTSTTNTYKKTTAIEWLFLTSSERFP